VTGASRVPYRTSPEEKNKEHNSTDDLLNTPETVQAFGREYKIKRFALGPLTRAAEHLAPLGYLMRSVTGNEVDIGQMIAQALATAGEPALGLISVATEEPIEWLEDKDPIEALELLSVIVEKNVRYFFAPANKSRIEAAFARIRKAVQTESGKSVISSAPGDTAT
jgi:hypothetical protein